MEDHGGIQSARSDQVAGFEAFESRFVQLAACYHAVHCRGLAWLGQPRHYGHVSTSHRYHHLGLAFANSDLDVASP